MSEATEVKWVRTLKSKYVFSASKRLLKRNDMFPCDIEGRLLSSGTVEPPVAKEEPAKVDENDDAANAAENARREDLIEKARELGIKNAHKMKEETLLDRIAEAEALAAESGDEE
jgi:hypothetical protein